MFVLQGFTLLVSCVLLLTVQSSCGSEIIDGKEVVPHSLPYMALLENKHGPECGGTLISPSWVLTAAHCKGIKTVRLGVHKIKEQNEDSWQSRNIRETIIHPNYNKDTYDNDLMLLKLDEEVKETKTVKPLTLGATMKEPAAGTKCLVAGWGTTDYTVKKPSEVLMSASIFIVDRDKCNSTYHHQLTENMICAGSVGTSRGRTCKGDSGGPLVCNGALVGVTSFGPEKCGFSEKPGVYAYLSIKNLNWIKTEINKF